MWRRGLWAEDTTRRHVRGACLDLSVWMKRWIYVNVLLSVALYHWSQRVSQNVIIFLWWQFFRNNMMGSKVPSSLQSAVCWEWLLMPVEKVERIPFFFRKISSFSGQILNNNCPVLLCHLNRYPEIFTLWSDLIFLFMHVFCSHLLCVNRRRKNNLSALSLPMFL